MQTIMEKAKRLVKGPTTIPLYAESCEYNAKHWVLMEAQPGTDLAELDELMLNPPPATDKEATFAAALRTGELARRYKFVAGDLRERYRMMDAGELLKPGIGE